MAMNKRVAEQALVVRAPQYVGLNSCLLLESTYRHIPDIFNTCKIEFLPRRRLNDDYKDNEDCDNYGL